MTVYGALHILYKKTVYMPRALPLLSDPAVGASLWSADALAHAPAQVLASGHAVLDAQLPGNGWPVGALTELLQPPGVHCEWRLLLPALARSNPAQSIVLVGTPHVPFVPALMARGLAPRRLLGVAVDVPTERLWAAEQALRCADVAAVLVWLPQARADTLRRLHLAAAEHAKLLFAMRPWAARHEASPAPLRLGVQPQSHQDALAVEIIKRRGPLLEQPLTLSAQPFWLARLLAGVPAHENHHALDRLAATAG